VALLPFQLVLDLCPGFISLVRILRVELGSLLLDDDEKSVRTARPKTASILLRTGTYSIFANNYQA